MLSFHLPSPPGGDEHSGQGRGLNLQISIPHWCGKWVVPMADFKDGVVGAKSKNLANLRGKIPDWIKLPPAVTVPFSSFEQVWFCERGRVIAWSGGLANVRLGGGG